MSTPESIFIGDFSLVEPSDHTLRIAIKDNIDIADYRTTLGTRAFRNSPMATTNAAVIESVLQDPCSVVVGKTNLDELAAGIIGINPWFGTVPNPTDPAAIAGGSSGGSAAAVAAGLADIALGTDTGGSVRLPAAHCGIYGMKTTRGLLSLRGVHPLAQYLDTVGPLAGNFHDLALAMRLLNPHSGSTRDGRGESPTKIGRLVGTGFSTEWDHVTKDMLTVTGVETVDVELQGWRQAHHAAGTIMARQFWDNYGYLLADSPDSVGQVATAILEMGREVDNGSYRNALEFALEWTSRVQEVLIKVDALATLTVTDVPPRIPSQRDPDLLRFSYEVDEVNTCRTIQFSLSGHPALTFPLRSNSASIPLQLVGSYGTEQKLIAIGRELQESAEGLVDSWG